MRTISIIVAMVTLWILLLPSAARAETPILENVGAYILMEAASQTVLQEENGNKQLNCGYLSKLMTILLIAEDIETGKYLLSTEVTASQSVTGTKGAVVWLEPGDKMTVEELLKSAIIGNANDAVTVLAENSEQTVEKFVMRMNSEAFDMGLRNTAFYSPWGYDDEREYTCARDVAVICSELSRFEFLRPYFKTWRDFVKEGRTELVNENILSRTYEKHIGFKASHSERSGYCAAEGGINDSGVCYIAVVLGAADEDSSLGGAKKLVNSGFSGYKVTATMFPNEMLKPMKVRGGTESAVEIRLRCQSRLVIPKGVGELSTVVVLPEYISAPLKKGQRIGTAAFYSEKKLVCETDILADGDVDKLTWKFVFKKMMLNLLK